MKLIAFAVVLVLAPAFAQENPAAVKRLAVAPLTGARGVTVAARSIEREAEYPSVIHLKGDAEIRMPVCFSNGKKGALVCTGDTIVRADEAEYHEDTGEIEAHGNVRVTPLRSREKR